jgi:hypothetical protein
VENQFPQAMLVQLNRFIQPWHTWVHFSALNFSRYRIKELSSKERPNQARRVKPASRNPNPMAISTTGQTRFHP